MGAQHSGLCYMGPSPTHEGSTLMTQPQEGPHFPAPSHGLRPQWMKLGETESCSVVSDSPRPCGLYRPWILQARILERGAVPFFRGPSQPRDRAQVSCTAEGFFTSWATREAQEYWSGQLFPSPADLPDPGIKPCSPALQADSLPTEPPGGFPDSSVGKESTCSVGDLGSGDPPEKGTAAHSSILAWRIPFYTIKLHHETGRGNPNFQPPAFHPCISVNLPGVAKVHRSYLSSCC